MFMCGLTIKHASVNAIKLMFYHSIYSEVQNIFLDSLVSVTPVNIFLLLHNQKLLSIEPLPKSCKMP